MNEHNKIFTYDGDIYEIILKNKNGHPEIININTRKRPKSQKHVLRIVLHNMGFDIPTEPCFNTHQSIKLLYKIINNIPLNDNEKSLKY